MEKKTTATLVLLCIASISMTAGCTKLQEMIGKTQQQQTPQATATQPLPAQPPPPAQPAPGQPAPAQTPHPNTQQNQPPTTGRTYPGGAPQQDFGYLSSEVRSVIDDWANAINDMDISRHTSHYAPFLDRYFTKSGVSHETIAADKSRAFSKYHEMYMQLSNIDITVLSADRAKAEFNKEWTFVKYGGKPFSGEVRSRLILSKYQGVWHITSEEDLYQVK